MQTNYRYRALVEQMRQTPDTYFDAPSALGVHVFFQGYQQADQGLCPYLSAMAEEVSGRFGEGLSLGPGTILYATCSNDAVSYDLYLTILLDILARSALQDAAEHETILRHSLREFLPALRTRAPMLLGSWDVRDLRLFVGGFFRALEDKGHDVTEERARLAKFEENLQNSIRLSGRWDRLLFLEDGGKGRSAALFAEKYEAFLTPRPA